MALVRLARRQGTLWLQCGAEGCGVRSRLLVDGTWHDVNLGRNGAVAGRALEVAWRCRRLRSGWLTVQATLTNRGADPVRLGSLHLLEGEAFAAPAPEASVLVDSGGGWFAGMVRATASCPAYDEKWRVFVAAEDVAWAQAAMGADLEAGAHHSLGGVTVYHRGQGKPTWLFGTVTPVARCTTAPILLVDPASGQIRAWTIACDFAGHDLVPGASITSETAVVAVGARAEDLLEAWAGYGARLRHVRVRGTPPTGWISWYGYRLKIDEKQTLRTADMLKARFAGLGFRVMQLDLGYNQGDLPGEWFSTNERFPHGLAWLAAELGRRGFVLGAWVCPFLVAADSAFARAHPEALIRNRTGEPYGLGRWFWAPKCPLYLVDPTHPEGAAFLRRTIQHLRTEGVRYFKFDFTSRLAVSEPDFVLHDGRFVKGAEVYRHGLRILREASAPDDYVYWCSNLLALGLGLGDTSMTACDIGNTGFGDARRVEGRVEDLSYFRSQFVTTMSRWYLHRRLVWLNPDTLNVAPPADIEECRLRATLVALSGGQVFLGDRFDLAPDEHLEVIRKVTPPYGTAARSLDWLERVYPEGHPRVYHVPVRTGWDRRDLVALINWADADSVLSVDLRRLGHDASTRFHAWEFWEERYVGLLERRLALPLCGPATRLVILVPERPYPWVLATTFHVAGGGVDLARVRWDPCRCRLSGTLLRPAGATGSIYLTVPGTFRCSLPQVTTGIHRLALQCTGERTPWSVTFE